MDAMKKVRSGLDRMFEKSLQDLVRLVRNNKHREKEFINEALEGKVAFFEKISISRRNSNRTYIDDLQLRV